MGQTDLTRPLGRTGGWADPEPHCGNAEHGTLPVRPYDLLTLAACHTLASLWRLLGLRNAAGMLRHYLRGDGTPHRVDAERLLALPAVRAAAEAQLARWRAEALERWAAAGDRAPAAYPADSGWRDVLISRHVSPDWWLALRYVEFRLTGTVRVAADGATVVDYRCAVHKAWNFDRGGRELGVPFTPFARLHETGLAKEFAVTGEAFGHHR